MTGAADEDRCVSLHPVGNRLQVSMNYVTLHTRAEVNVTLMTRNTTSEWNMLLTLSKNM